MTPTELTDFKDYPRVQRFVRKRISMLFEDLRKLMVQPGFNFPGAAGCCDLVSGLSVSLYRPASAFKIKKDWFYKDNKGTTRPLGSGILFDQVLKLYYPWQKGERRARKATVIWRFIRNPLAHALGVEDESGLRIDAAKCKRLPDKTAVPLWTSDELDALERDD